MDLSHCIPTGKFDVAAVQRAAQIGLPGINPILGDLLEWLQDYNWPVASAIHDLLKDAGPEIVPHIEAILSSDDEIWKYWVLALVEDLPRQTLDELDVNLFVRISENPTDTEREEEIDTSAAQVLEIIGPKQL
ncbi:MAG: DUF5071 domain-containing protein [Pseudomonadota bacterium]